MRINGSFQIKSEDYDDEYQQLIDQLGQILNPFMQEVSELSDERIDFENRVEVKKNITITVDSNGKPTLNDKISTDKSKVNGTQVVRAYNLTNLSNYATSQPFISYTELGGGVIRVDNISGLVANNKYRLTVIFY